MRKGPRIRRKTRAVVNGYLDLMGPVDNPTTSAPERDARPRIYTSLKEFEQAERGPRRERS